MAKKNLAEELGSNYVTEFYNGALFVHDNKLCSMRGVVGKNIVVDQVDLVDPKDWIGAEYPLDTIDNFSKFQWPTLGYREMPSAKYGNLVLHISANRSAHRGLRFEHLHIDMVPVVKRLRGASYEWEDRPRQELLINIFRPKFTKFTEGLKLLLAGDIPAFAVNEHLAVALSVDQADDRAYDIYFRQKIVGNVSENGSVTISNKIIQRDSVRTALFG